MLKKLPSVKLKNQSKRIVRIFDWMFVKESKKSFGNSGGINGSFLTCFVALRNFLLRRFVMREGIIGFGVPTSRKEVIESSDTGSVTNIKPAKNGIKRCNSKDFTPLGYRSLAGFNH